MLDNDTYKRLFHKYRELYYTTQAKLATLQERVMRMEQDHKDIEEAHNSMPWRRILLAADFVFSSQERSNSFSTWRRAMQLPEAA